MVSSRLAVLLALAVASLLAQKNSSPRDIKPKFRTNTKTLEAIRDRNDEIAMRRQAWKLFRGITQMVPSPDGIDRPQVPLWLSWPSEEEVFHPSSRGFFHGLTLPSQFFLFNIAFDQLPQALHSRSSDDLQHIALSEVSFNPPSAAAMGSCAPLPALPRTCVTPIEQQTIIKADAELSRNAIKGSRRTIASFPYESIVTKTAWIYISRNDWKLQQTPVWRGLAANHNPKGPLRPANWSSKIVIDPTTARFKCDPSKIQNCYTLRNRRTLPPRPNNSSEPLPQVPIDDFFYVPVCSCDQAQFLTEKFPSLAGIDAGDYLVLMGLHFTTREIPNWTWSTVWWNSDAKDPYAQNRPWLCKPWNKYVMNTTLSMLNRDGKPIAIFNPWLELPALPDATSSNCMSCHRAAAYIPDLSSAKISGEVTADDPGLAEKTKLDFLWSIARQFIGSSPALKAPSPNR